MADINDLFEVFPDYNVFDDSTTPAQKQRKVKKVKKSRTPETEIQDNRRRDDYNDGFGIYEVKKEQKQNFTTIFFFPLLILCLEFALRLSCGESFFTINLLYIFLFSIPFSCLLTFLCTFANARLNRHFARILALIVTLWYCLQIIYHQTFNEFLTFSQDCPKFDSLENFINAIVIQRIPLIIAVVPLIIFTLAGRFIFPFKKTPIPAKVSLILFIILFQFSALVAINFSSDAQIHSSYYGELNSVQAQENFGLVSMTELDISHLIGN